MSTAPPLGDIALHLIRQAGTDAATQAPPNWDLYHELTDHLKRWQEDGTLVENAALLVEWLAVEVSAATVALHRSWERAEMWLVGYGDEVCRAQQHEHPAGPTAVAIISSTLTARDAATTEPAGLLRVTATAAAVLGYLRPGKEIEDGRELALTFILWAGTLLAQLLKDPAVIADYRLPDPR
ncbi:hypothetical protein ABZ605_27730 [Streptomyces sp. NPDC012765]|uniref:hypothetical protein n=1 Tax=Streptomyces sp. NPDC012765 TaxID=3155249 RepID=UPI0033CF5CB4